MNLSVPCSLACEHAHALPPPYLDWVWCALPNAAGPQRLDLTFCPFFRTRTNPTAGQRENSGTQESSV